MSPAPAVHPTRKKAESGRAIQKRETDDEIREPNEELETESDRGSDTERRRRRIRRPSRGMRRNIV